RRCLAPALSTAVCRPDPRCTVAPSQISIAPADRGAHSPAVSFPGGFRTPAQPPSRVWRALRWGRHPKPVTLADSCNAAKKRLFDHFVGAGENRRRDGEAEYPGGLRVDDQLERARLHYGQVRRFCTFEDAPSVDSCLTKPVRDVGSVAH